MTSASHALLRRWLPAVFLLASTAAHADGPLGGPGGGELLMALFEPVIPDLRWEWSARGRGPVLSFPVHVRSDVLDGPGPLEIAGSLFLEPQLGLRPDVELRGLLGARFHLLEREKTGTTLILESAGVAEPSGLGVMAGAGIGLAFHARGDDRLFTLALMARRTWAPGNIRHDVSLDFTVPLPLEDLW